MNTKKYKLFFYNGNIHFEHIPDYVDYYEYIRLKVSDGNRQVIIPSNVMMDILKDLYDRASMKKSSFIRLKRIQFIDDDSELNDSVTEFIMQINRGTACIEKLIEHLRSLFDEQLVEIRNIEFDIIDGNNMYIFNLYVNGILYINTFKDTKECKEILTHLSQVIWSKMRGWFN